MWDAGLYNYYGFHSLSAMKYAFGMQTDLHVRACACVRTRVLTRVRFARYTRDRVQSRDIERKEKDGGELMRKRRRIQSIPIDNPTPHFKRILCVTVAQFLKNPLKIMGQH